MSSDPDSCIPGPLKDFVFDLHDSVRTSQIPSEQLVLYNGTFRELTAKYYAQGPWPSPQSITNECGSDTLFLALYKELTQRHLHSISRPSVRDRIDGWHVYRTLFDLLLAEATPEVSEEDGTDTNAPPPMGGDALYILPEWSFDILHEFVYQFQGFCQFRTSTYANAAKYAPDTTDETTESSTASTPATTRKQIPNHIIDSLDVLSKNRDAWAVETVLFYLHRLVSVGNDSPSPAFRYLGLFASVTLARLECLLGDYRASLAALKPVMDVETTIAPPRGADDDDDVGEDGDEENGPGNKRKESTPEEIVSSVFAARLSMAYHAGVSYLMLRRYKDAARILGTICSFMQRGFKTGHLKKLPNSDQFPKLYDRMIALLAILTHVCTNTSAGGGASHGSSSSTVGSSSLVEDAVYRAVREKHGNQLSKIEAGEEGYEDLFIFACPKFVSPAVPDYSRALTAVTGGESSSSTTAAAAVATGGVQDAVRLQVKHFLNEMASQQTMRKLRSYMKLYTSISVEKLGRLVLEDEFLALLLSYKQRMRQVERDVTGSSADAHLPLGGAIGTALDIHYYIEEDIVHVDEAEKQHRFENYFISQIAQNNEIIKDLENISVHI